MLRNTLVIVLLIEADVGGAAVGFTLLYFTLFYVYTRHWCRLPITTGTLTLSSSTRSGTASSWSVR